MSGLKRIMINKKVFQLNADCPLADRLDFIVNKFKHVGGGPCMVGKLGLGPV